jgi:hypothetical protein
LETTAPAAIETSLLPSFELEQVVQIPTFPFYSSMRSILSEQTDGHDYVFNVAYVIGTGGTGGFLIPHLARYIASLPYSKYCLIVLVDGDTVEDKNIIRQNFIRQDVGKNKAEVLAKRYSAAFGVPIVSVPEHLTESNIPRIFSNSFAYENLRVMVPPNVGVDFQGHVNHMVISCVDNNKTRSLISNRLGWTHSTPSTLFRQGYTEQECAWIGIHSENRLITDTITWIDSGNESTTGQVICSYDAFMGGSPHRHQGQVLDAVGTNGKAYASPSINGIRVRNFGEYFNAMLDSNINWETYYDETNRNHHRRGNNLIPCIDMIKRTKDQMASNAASFYMETRQPSTDPKDVTFREMVANLNVEDPGYNVQLDFLIGLLIDYGYSPLWGHITPPVTYVYPMIFESKDKLNTELSCAERSVIDPQNLMVNALAASYIMNYVSAIFAPNAKRAFLESYGCCWSGSNCQELYITKKNTKAIFEAMWERLLVSNPGNMHGNIGATPLSRGDDMSPEFNGVERVPMTRKKLLEEFYPQSKMEDYLIPRQKSGTYEF